VPFENLGLLPYFEADFIATASDVLEAENMYFQMAQQSQYKDDLLQYLIRNQHLLNHSEVP
jgi:phosphoglycolate phosphatase-like HAD superfamily hydrolase